VSDFKKIAGTPAASHHLSKLYDLAHNTWMFWNPEAIDLFIRMDADLWNKTGHNPKAMLGEIDQERLAELAGDESYVLETARVWQKLKDYLGDMKSCTPPDVDLCRIGYLSLEYGLTEAIPIYAGGLGVLAGEHIKSASDLGLHLTGIGLLYRYGYVEQRLGADGWQHDFNPVNDFRRLPIEEVCDPAGSPVEIGLPFPGRTVVLNVFKLLVGRIVIYLLDADSEKNRPEDRKLTAHLYGGDREMRLQQEIILGLGGIRLLDRLGIQVDVIHLNEGHSSFALFERVRLLMEKQRIGFDLAMEVTRKSSVFTTHTPVAAANDAFSPDLIKRYFKEYVQELGISIEDFLRLGRQDPGGAEGDFSMPVAAIRYTAYINGVSMLHAGVAREMWRHLWPEMPKEHIPIRGITNGVHLPSWLSPEMADLFRRFLGDRWQELQDTREVWERVSRVPDSELWRAHSIRRRHLVYFIRERLKKQLLQKGAPQSLVEEAAEALNPEALTIGFARRFTSYKRGDLVLRDPNRLLNILNNPERPVQLIFAGKAHPHDLPGKEIIKKIIHFIDAHNLVKKVIFIEDYDMNIARYLVQGVDVWLNNPIRPQEASGTSGMKAAINGVLNFSVLDGWWDEAYNRFNGWAIGCGDVSPDRDYQDQAESQAIYSIIEKNIVPLFYDQRPDDLPGQWIQMMKNAIISIGPVFNTQRMVKEYFNHFYRPAARNFSTLTRDGFSAARQFLQWQERVRKDFPGIRVENTSFAGKRVYRIGDEVQIDIQAFLGRLSPQDIRVDLYYGQTAAGDGPGDSRAVRLTSIEDLGDNRFRFSGKLACRKTGECDFKIRVTPDHALMGNAYEMRLVLWA